MKDYITAKQRLHGLTYSLSSQEIIVLGVLLIISLIVIVGV